MTTKILADFQICIIVPLRRWIPNPGVPCSKPLGGSKVDSAFHPSEVDKNEYQKFLGTQW